MNIVRNSGIAFDTDRLFATNARVSLAGSQSAVPVQNDGIVSLLFFILNLAGAFKFYRTPPTGEMTMQKMDQLAKLRLGLLRLIEKKLQGFDGSMDAFIDEQSLNIITSIPSNFRESADEDVASHFILRLGLSKSQDFIDWFIKNEEALFLCKLRQTGSEGLSRIMRESPELSHLARDVISRQINSNEFEEIRRSTPAPGDQATLFYKIRFTEIPAHLISRRSVVVIGGIAYVPDKEMITLIGRKYRDHLMGAMMVAARERGRMINEDERIKIIADRMSPAALLTSNKISSLSPTEKLSLSNFNILLGRSIPPCMRVAIESMRPSEGSRSGGRHLKNTGRNQLAPFLRTAGMSLDESLQWWRTEFTRGSQMDSDKFDKNYTYNIKWVYGKAGRMKEAAPMSCSTIINLEYPSHDQTHGCPFKVFDESRITNLLKGWLTKAGVPLDTNEGRIKEIARKATGQSHEYQLACVDWFTLMHEGHSGDGIGNHPNSYFSESVAYWADRDGTTDESGVSTKMNVDSRGDSEVSVSQAHAG